MPASAHPQSTQPAPRGGVEPADVNVKGVAYFVIGLAVVMVLVHMLLTVMFDDLKRKGALEDQRIQQREVTAPVAAARVYFPPPHEQFSPQLDLQAWRAQQEAELNSYGWIDRNAGVARIPIGRAMELISERGLPTRTGSNAPATGPSTLDLQRQRPVQSSPPRKEEGK
ncbi:MAG: hypothetical protein JWQ04_1267 [Pedosphaera sp.]|nr:hypothetical protein [Pedosphaera sp.]